MRRLIYLILLGVVVIPLSSALAAEAQVKKKYKLVVSGAGPAGMAAALSAVRAGISPKDILVIEKRLPKVERGHGTLNRVVVLDGASERILDVLGVRLPGTPLRQMVVHLERGGARFFPNSGTWKSAIETFFGGRLLNRLTSLGDLTRAMTGAFEGQGGKVVYGSMATLEAGKEGAYNIILNGKEISADLIVVAEGEHSQMAKNVPRQSVAESSTSHFLTIDVPFDESRRVNPGEVHSISLPRQNIMVYGFIGKDSASINMMLPMGIEISDLTNDLKTRYENLLISTAERFGLSVSEENKVAAYEGRLSMAEAATIGNVALIGNALRSTDAISGTGANVALKDGVEIGRYMQNLKEMRHLDALQVLNDSLAENTNEAFEFSLFFREMAAQGFRKPDLLEGLVLLGLTDRGAGATSMDTVKSVYADIFSLFGKKFQGNIIKRGMAAFDAPAMPFESSARKKVIGEPHSGGVNCRDLLPSKRKRKEAA